MQITITFADKTTTITADADAMVATLRAALVAVDPASAGAKLTCGGSVLADDTATLAAAGLTEGAVVQAATVRKISNTRCNHQGCTDKVAKIIGDCRFCASKFCSRHRLPESHACEGIDSCRQASFDKNAKLRAAEKISGCAHAMKIVEG
ncbi:hypothetical protein BC828DRAFT_216144 [Blastocladiella britannica]|nr:hypothetical protein BC828DRAFT_216144 [Blastocladiella britannica]